MHASASDSRDELQALVAIYQAERSDASAILNIGLALVGAGAAYSVGTIAFSNQFGNSVGWAFVALLPIPLWLISAFHSLIFTLGTVCGLSALFLEEEIFKRSGIDVRYRALIGSRARENVMNAARSTYPHMLATYVTYIGIGSVIISYTIYIMYASWGGVGAWRYLFLVAYTILFGTVLLSWISGIRTVANNWANSGLLQKRWRRW
jgi:fatty acid desaturase